jgi:hypothetical protein
MTPILRHDADFAVARKRCKGFALGFRLRRPPRLRLGSAPAHSPPLSSGIKPAITRVVRD